jgi:isochorismate synthase
MSSELFFEKIYRHFENKLPFVCKAQQGSLKAYLQKNDTLVEVSDFNSSGFVFCPFSPNNKSIIFPEAHTEVLEAEMKSNFLDIDKHSIEESQDAKIQHIQLVDTALKYIKTGLAKKIVCSRKIKVFKQIEPLETFQNLANLYPEAYTYCWYHPKIGLWLGATPEQFVNLDRNKIKTAALAGTQDASVFPKPKWRDKEMQEQQMVTDFIVDTLKKHSSKVNIGQVESVKAGNLWHLKTKISAEIQPKDLSSVIKELNPTSAVCGLPQSKAKAFIQDYEGYDREYYSGFLGELNMKTLIRRRKQSLNEEQLAIKSIKTISDLYVNLRCMKVYEEYVEIFVGGGITEESEPKAEYLETVAKSQTLLNVL